MSKYRDNFRKIIERELGEYIPNKVDLDNLVTYLYKSFIGVIRKDLSSEDLSKVPAPNEVERQAFLRSVTVISLSASRKALFETLTETFNSIKNSVPQYKVSTQSDYNPIIGYKSTNTVLEKAPEADFQINVSDLGPEFTEAYESATQEIETINAKQTHNNLSLDSNERDFDLDSSFIDRINNRSYDAIQQATGIAKSVVQEDTFLVTTSDSKPFNIDEEIVKTDISDEEMDNRMIKDAGLLSSGVFKKEIKVSTDLDY